MTKILTVNKMYEKECTNSKGEKFTCWRVGCKEGVMFTMTSRTSGFKTFDISEGMTLLVDLFGKEKDGSIWWNATKVQDFEALTEQQQLIAYLRCIKSDVDELRQEIRGQKPATQPTQEKPKEDLPF